MIFALLVIIPFLIWGDLFQGMFTYEGAIDSLKNYNSWAWLMGILLLIGDLFLPLPATLIMAALGFLYGQLLGGILSITGSFLSGALAYELCHLAGENGARFILGNKGLEKGHRMFRNVGGWLVALSRWLPVFPEVIACMAGLNRMPRSWFYIALACGTVPLGFVYAYIGYLGIEQPSIAIILSAALPAVLWSLIWWFKRDYFTLKEKG